MPATASAVERALHQKAIPLEAEILATKFQAFHTPKPIPTDGLAMSMITKDLIASKKQLEAMLPDLWMQNDDNNAAFGHCMAWERWHENYYKHVMLINPKFKILDRQANVDFKIVSGLFMDDNYFELVKEKEAWLISQFMRPIY